MVLVCFCKIVNYSTDLENDGVQSVRGLNGQQSLFHGISNRLYVVHYALDVDVERIVMVTI